MIDTHAHLCDETFVEDLDDVLARACKAGVTGIVAVGENLADAVRSLEISERFPGFVHATAGLFPTLLDHEEFVRVGDFVRSESGRFIAIGEVGLDRWIVKDEAKREIQRHIFTGFIGLSKELDLPLNVHSRSAGRATIDLLLEQGATKVQLHAFDGRAANALPGVEAGFYFSVPPSIVRSAQKQKLVRRLPLDCLLLETDSPVLGPDPQERNEPGNVAVALVEIARIKELPVEAVREATTRNAHRLYRGLRH